MSTRLSFLVGGSLAILFLAGGALSCVGEAAAQAAAPASTVELSIEGMTCASCQIAVRTALGRLDGVQEVKVSVPEKRATVAYDPGKVTPQRLVEAVNRLGYRASLPARAP